MPMRKLRVGPELAFKYFVPLLYCLYFNDDQIIHEKISHKARLESNAVIDNRQLHLPLHIKTALCQLVRELTA